MWLWDREHPGKDAASDQHGAELPETVRRANCHRDPRYVTEPTPGSEVRVDRASQVQRGREVRISSNSGSFRYAANSFRFVTGDNHSCPPVAEDTGQAFGPPLGAGTLTAGQAVSATITFDVPIGGGHVGFFDQSGLQMCGWPVAN